MSTSHPHIPPFEVREDAACMCAHGYECSSYAPGHAIHLIQARLAAATPSDWVDATVEATDAESGTIVLRTVADAKLIEVWTAATAPHAIAPGSPVAVHSRYHVLADGTRRFNVAV